jgi:hypothetical protein
MALADLNDDELEEVLDFLFSKTLKREQAELAGLFRAHRAFSAVAQSRDSSKGVMLFSPPPPPTHTHFFFCY